MVPPAAQVEAGPPPPRGALRSLADDLRTRSPQRLARMMAARPDLCVPAPRDLSTLAQRAAAQPSVSRLLDRLSLGQYIVLEALCVVPEPASVEAVVALLGDADGGLARITEVRELGLVWGDDTGLFLVRSARALIGEHPADLGPALQQILPTLALPALADIARTLGLGAQGDATGYAAAIADHLAAPNVLDSVTTALDPAARDLLVRLDAAAAGLPLDVAQALPTAADRTLLAPLIGAGLLIPSPPRGRTVDAVSLPREVGLWVRGGRIRDPRSLVPPSADADSDDSAVRRASRVAAGGAADVVRRISVLLDAIGADPPTLTGGTTLSQRDLRRLSDLVADTPDHTAALLELAYIAGLVGTTVKASATVDATIPCWAPSLAYDRWRAASEAARWAQLVRAWLASDRRLGTVQPRVEETGQRAWQVLSPDAELRGLGSWRAWCAEGAAATTAPGATIDWERAGRWAAWHGPRGVDSPAAAAARTVVSTEMDLLGLTALDRVSDFARALLDGADDTATDLLASHLPPPVRHVVIQTDLTAVAPGPLELDVARRLAEVADVEATGSASVYRFSAASVARALSSGRTASEVLDFLRVTSVTPLPQSLEYLVNDAARRRCGVRVVSVSTLVLADTDELAEELLDTPTLAVLGMRRIAPGVLVTDRSAASVVTAISDAAVDLTHMVTVVQGESSRPTTGGARRAVRVHRANTGGPATTQAERRPPATEELDALVTRLLAGTVPVEDDLTTAAASGPTAADGAERRPPNAPATAADIPPMKLHDTVTVLEHARQLHALVDLAHVDAYGQPQATRIRPIGLTGGTLVAEPDDASGTPVRIPLRRVRGALPVDDR